MRQYFIKNYYMEVNVLNIKTTGKVIKFKICIVDIPEFKDFARYSIVT